MGEQPCCQLPPAPGDGRGEARHIRQLHKYVCYRSQVGMIYAVAITYPPRSIRLPTVVLLLSVIHQDTLATHTPTNHRTGDGCDTQE